MPHLPLGAPPVDDALGGGLLEGALHDVSAGPGGDGALGAFACGVAARALARHRRPVLLVQQELARWEAGAFYAPGLQAFGLPPEAVLLVKVRKPADVLFAMEEGLRCAGLAAVLGMVFSALPEALTATRRLSLAAREHGGLGLMLRHGEEREPSAAVSRWRLSALPSPAPDGLGGLGPPCVRARLVRNRFGPLGEWPLVFAAGAFHPVFSSEAGHDRSHIPGQFPGQRLPALSQPRPAPSRHGSPRTADVA